MHDDVNREYRKLFLKIRHIVSLREGEYVYIIHPEIFHGNKSDDAWRENHNELCLHRLDMNLTWA